MNIPRRCSAEFIGTFWPVLGGCGTAMLAASFAHLGVGFVGVALAFGLMLATIAYSIGHVDGSSGRCGKVNGAVPEAGTKHVGFPLALILLASSVMLLTVSTVAVSGSEPDQGGLLKVAALGEGQAATGIREALLTSTVNAVHLTGRPNGYFANPAIKILLPQSLKPLESGLRVIGYGPKIDQFVLSMNRAAEAAAPLAKPIFERAIMNMTLTDAQRIITGGGHSATDYFEEKTSSELTTAFTPIIKKTMGQYSVSRQYDDLLGQYQSGPLEFGTELSILTGKFDIDSYVVQKSLDGLFYVVGQQEQKIRTNPAAQVTPLLRQVFGGLR